MTKAPLFLVIAVVVGLGFAGRGQACSRTGSLVPVEPRALVAGADAAFVGTLASVRALQPPVLSDAPFVLTFVVEELVKGDLPDRVEVVSALGGGSCGFEGTIGRRTGLLLRHREGEFGPWFVEEVDLETLRRGALPLPKPNGVGRPTLLVGGNFGDARSATIDQRGRTLAYGFGRGAVTALSVCPGGLIAAELVQADGKSSVALRRLPGLALIGEREIVPGTYGSEVFCLNRQASDVLAVSGRLVGSEQEALLLRSTPFGTTVLERARELSVTVHGRIAFVSFPDGGLIARNLSSGDRRQIAHTAGLMTGMSVNPGGRLVAGYMNRSLALVNLATRTERTRSGLNQVGQTTWLDQNTLIAAGSDPSLRSSGRIEVLDPSLRLRRPPISWTPRLTAVGGGTAFGVEWSGVLVSVSVTGPVVRRGPLFSPAISALALLRTP